MAVLNITKENFEQEVMKSDVPVLIDFWAPWCGPCKMMGPIIDELEKEATNSKVGKVNVDEQQELASRFDVMSIPTIVVIKDGKLSDVAVGLRPKEELLKMLEK